MVEPWIHAHLIQTMHNYHNTPLDAVPATKKPKLVNITKILNIDAENAATTVWAIASDTAHSIAVKLTTEDASRVGPPTTVSLESFRPVCTKTPDPYSNALSRDRHMALVCDALDVGNFGGIIDATVGVQVNNEDDISAWVDELKQGGVDTSSAPVSMLEAYQNRHRQELENPFSFFRSATRSPSPPVDARDMGSSSPAHKYSSPGPASPPLSGWHSSPRPQYDSSRSSPASSTSSRHSSSPAPQPASHGSSRSAGNAPRATASSSSQAITSSMSAPTPAQRTKQPTPSPDDEVTRPSKRQRTSPPAFERRVPPPPAAPAGPTSSEPSRILVPSSEPSHSQTSMSMDEDDRQIARKLGLQEVNALDGLNMWNVETEGSLVDWERIARILVVT